MTAQERAQCEVLAAWLHALARLAPVALLIAAAALAALVFDRWHALAGGATAAFAAAALLLVPERYFALRLALDARLFQALAAGRVASLADLDGALAALHLRKQAQATRSLAARIAGTRRLARGYLVTVLAQIVLFAIALCMP